MNYSCVFIVIFFLKNKVKNLFTSSKADMLILFTKHLRVIITAGLNCDLYFCS